MLRKRKSKDEEIKLLDVQIKKLQKQLSGLLIKKRGLKKTEERPSQSLEKAKEFAAEHSKYYDKDEAEKRRKFFKDYKKKPKSAEIDYINLKSVFKNEMGKK